MSTQRSEFVDLAAELFVEFADFAQPAEIVKNLGFSYGDQTHVTLTQTQPLIQLDYETGQHDGELIKVGDTMLAGELSRFVWEPEPGNTTLTHAGVHYRVNRFEKDPAGAVALLHVRRV